MADQRNVRRFHRQLADDRNLSREGRKLDSNYFRRHLRGKKIAAITHLIQNTDQLFITASSRLPEFKPGLVDRFLILAMLEGVRPVVVIGKADLAEPGEIDGWRAIWEPLGVETLPASAITDEGVPRLAELLTGRITAFVGHSGVGKTSLLRRVDPSYTAAVQEISSFTKRGRHTTTVIRQHELADGGLVYDMPGLKEIDFMSIRRRELRDFYPDFAEAALLCRYKDCIHAVETDCGVRRSVEARTVHPVRYENYLQILDSLPEEK